MNEQAGASTPHRWKHRAVDADRTKGVGAHQLLNLCHGKRFDRAYRAAPGIIDDDVDMSSRAQDAINTRVDRPVISHVHVNDFKGKSTLVRPAEESTSGGSVLRGDAAHRGKHAMTFPGQGLRRQLAEAAGAPGDENRCAVDVSSFGRDPT